VERKLLRTIRRITLKTGHGTHGTLHRFSAVRPSHTHYVKVRGEEEERKRRDEPLYSRVFE
jgi:hypothetical protein